MSNVLQRLAITISARTSADSEKSYTASLLAKGPGKCAEKFGEEAVEAIIAAVSGNKSDLAAEAADVLFHLQVMLTACDVEWSDVEAELERREGVSGHVEKASRVP